MKKILILVVMATMFACKTNDLEISYADQAVLPVHTSRIPYHRVVEIFQQYPAIPIEQYLDPIGKTAKGSGYILFNETELHDYCKQESEYFHFLKESKAFSAFLFDIPSLTIEQYYSKRSEYPFLEKVLKTRFPKSDSLLHAALLQEPYIYVTKDSILTWQNRSKGKISSLPGARCLNCD